MDEKIRQDVGRLADYAEIYKKSGDITPKGYDLTYRYLSYVQNILLKADKRFDDRKKRVK